MTFAIMACMLLAACCLFYVFYLPGTLQLGPEKTRVSYLLERKEMVYENLRDLNFDFGAGKLPAEDYENMKTSLEDEAASILAEVSDLQHAVVPAASLRIKR